MLPAHDHTGHRSATGPATTDPATTDAGPTDPGATSWFVAAPAQVAATRARLRTVLDLHRVADAVAAQAELILSELVTNAVLHSVSSRIGLRIDVRPHRLHVEVQENRASAAPNASDGRGLGIVDWLAAEWGTHRVASVTTTWFEMALDPGPDVADASAHAPEQPLVSSLQAALGRSRMLLRLTEELGDARTPDAVAVAVTRALRGHLGALFTGIALRSDDRMTMRYRSLDPLPEATVERWQVFPLDNRSPVAAATLNRQAYFHESRADVEQQFPGIATQMEIAGAGALAHLPLTRRGMTFGTLALAWAQPMELTPDCRALLLVVAGYCAQALARS